MVKHAESTGLITSKVNMLQVGALQTWAAALAYRDRYQERLSQPDKLSYWRRHAYQLGNLAAQAAMVAAAAGVFRATGAIMEFDEVPSLATVPVESSAPSLLPPVGPSVQLQGGTDIVLAANVMPVMTEAPPLPPTEITLPSAPGEHPVPVGLEPYNPQTGEGTIWHQMETYTALLEYHNLTGHQLHEVVEETLELNGITWEGARSLPIGYEPLLPTPGHVEGILDSLGAVQTQEPVFDKSVEPPVAPPPPQQPEPPPPVSPEPPPPPVVLGEDATFPLPFTDLRVEFDDAVAVGATLAAVGATLYALHERNRRLAVQPIIDRIREEEMRAKSEAENTGDDEDEEDSKDTKRS